MEKTINDFYEDLAARESNGDYKAKNKYVVPKPKELSNPSNKDVKENLNGINKNLNNLFNHNKHNDDLLNENENEQENNLDESNSEIITKIKLNYDSQKENKNENENNEDYNSYIIKQFNSFFNSLCL